jgi:hypothetical protein
MSPRLTQLLAAMTPQEQTEVEAFAAFLIVRVTAIPTPDRRYLCPGTDRTRGGLR